MVTGGQVAALGRNGGPVARQCLSSLYRVLCDMDPRFERYLTISDSGNELTIGSEVDANARVGLHDIGSGWANLWVGEYFDAEVDPGSEQELIVRTFFAALEGGIEETQTLRKGRIVKATVAINGEPLGTVSRAFPFGSERRLVTYRPYS